MVQSAQKNSVEQRSVCSETYPNLSSIVVSLHKALGAPNMTAI